MLGQLDIRNIVLIDRLQIDLKSGLSVLTGETGAGKSILLDALGLVRGARADLGLIRAGTNQASVTAVFDVADDHAVFAVLDEQGIDHDDGVVTLRRVISQDGKSKAFINDQPISVQLMKTIGQMLIDIHGQFETGRLFDPTYHRDLVDAFGGCLALRKDVAIAWRAFQEARLKRDELQSSAAQAKRDEEYIRATLEDLKTLDPQAGEEEKLLARKKYLQDSGQILELINDARACLSDDESAETYLQRAARVLDRLHTKWPDHAAPWLASIDQALELVRDVVAGLENTVGHGGDDNQTIDQVEDRLYALRGFARRLNVTVDELPEMVATLQSQLDLIRDQSDMLAGAAAVVQRAETAYAQQAGALSQKRTVAAKKLDKAVMIELPPLKLDKAVFNTLIEPLPSDHYGPDGMDRVQFMVATNPGSAPGALDKIASGGELSRLMLALKVVAQTTQDGARTLIFDEVDAGLGGAVAAAVADRLKRMADTAQVLVVTHAPQVAGVADHHFVVAKTVTRGVTTTSIDELDNVQARREEIARMLSGATITDEARSAAARLLDPKVA